MQERSSKTIRWLLIVGVALALPVVTLSFGKGKTVLSPTAKAGKKLFDQDCTLCHFANQTRTKIGPGLKGLFKHKQLPYSHRPTTVSNVIEQIEKGNPKGKPMPMRPFGSKLSKAQINNVIAYLKTL